MRKADVIDYRLIGDDLQAVIITLDPGEAVTAEAGAMMYMEDGIRPITTLDPNNEGGSLLGKLMGGAKRVISGESFMMTMFLTLSAVLGNGGASCREYSHRVCARVCARSCSCFL